MNRCPLCGQIYSEELMYCLQDGTALIGDQSDQEIPTVIRPTPPEAARKPYLKYAVFALIGLFGVTIASALGAFFIWHWLAGPDTETAQNTRPNVSPTPRPTATPRPASPSPTRAVTENNRATPSPTDTPEPADEDTFRDPGPSRINFRRGRVSESVSGRVAKNRSFVLRTLGGQYLTSSVSSDGGCVEFANGSTSMAFSTPAGDSRLDLRNNCGQPARFSLSVTVR